MNFSNSFVEEICLYLLTGVREISYHPDGLTTWPLPAAFIWGVSNENVTEIYLVKNFT
jgi:hypothetical protein